MKKRWGHKHKQTQTTPNLFRRGQKIWKECLVYLCVCLFVCVFGCVFVGVYFWVCIECVLSVYWGCVECVLSAPATIECGLVIDYSTVSKRPFMFGWQHRRVAVRIAVSFIAGCSKRGLHYMDDYLTHTDWLTLCFTIFLARPMHSLPLWPMKTWSYQTFLYVHGVSWGPYFPSFTFKLTVPVLPRCLIR